MRPAESVADARQHHIEYGDMDGEACLLSKCALHYPQPIFIRAECGCRLRVVSGLPVLSEGILETNMPCEAHSA